MLLLRDGEIVSRLQSQPQFGAGFEIAAKTQGGFRGDGAPAFTISEIRLAGTRRRNDRASAESPRASISPASKRPGRTGRSGPTLSMVVDNFDIVRISLRDLKQIRH